MKHQNVTYIKLAAYLGNYWRRVMQLKPEEPLVLPNMEQRRFFYPFLYENVDMVRSQSRNSKGYYKDAQSYSQQAYNIAIALSQKAEVDIDVTLKKVPTIEECVKLQPFVLPEKLFTATRGEVSTNGFYELKDKGVTLIRSYIRDFFYHELHTHVLKEQRMAQRLGREADTSLSIETWLLNLGILSLDDKYDSLKESIRISLYDYDKQKYASGDPDSIRRTFYSEIKNRHLPNNKVGRPQNNC